MKVWQFQYTRHCESEERARGNLIINELSLGIVE